MLQIFPSFLAVSLIVGYIKKRVTKQFYTEII
jgi:hypothetical protein